MGVYRVSGRDIRIEHGTGDTWIFQEVFLDGDYDFAKDAEPERILDLGGNIGMFTVFAASRWPRARITAFEPDPSNVAKYQWHAMRNQISGHLIEACAGVADGETPFAAGLEGGSHMASDGDDARFTVPVVDVFPYMQNADLIKMDIEGAEWAILEDPRLTNLRVPVLLLEIHRRGCPEHDTRGVANRLLGDAGFHSRFVRYDAASGVGVIHAVRS
jgi:FkbM family methyltransferase